MSTKMLQKPSGQVRIYRDPEELALKAARLFARLADQYVVGCGRFTVALSGGSTPKAMLSLLAADPFVDTVPWSSIYFFWGDERCVPPDHPDSNYRMASEALLSKVPVPPANVFRIPAENPDPQRAAEEYAATLTRFFRTGPGATRTGTAPLSNVPRFDLVFLGMGPDGHTASLFPHTTALQAGDQNSRRELCREVQSVPDHADGSYDQQRPQRDFSRSRRGQGRNAQERTGRKLST